MQEGKLPTVFNTAEKSSKMKSRKFPLRMTIDLTGKILVYVYCLASFLIIPFLFSKVPDMDDASCQCSYYWSGRATLHVVQD